ncbi:MAG: DNA mismatch repair endonuclease MutL [Planctomycetaceae bacterium]|jgi:DNA mismatch repair protein MutL|nr:DNA mismatch repair endonuclease MutL [Planctomycetaceae bacterium]
MPLIRQLPVGMINKIAAGEVIERPASVVKELVENSVDAGAARIDVSVNKGGTELIRITDNGCGIAPNQLLLALSSHATSKIAGTEDLFRISTFGFRGEALASVAEISQMVLRSRTEDSPEGAEIRSDGGLFSEIVPCGHPVGTSIEICNLFFNTPVRRKYLRSNQTELGHITETFLRLAIPFPGVHFTLRHNERVMYDLPPTADGTERIAKLFGRETAQGLIPVESLDGEVTVHGYVGHPNHSRTNNRMQYFFLNGRYIRDRALQHALLEAYRGLLTVGRFPIAFLHVNMSPDQFDVNVHPTKLEVRFLDSGKIYNRFLSTVREQFRKADLKSHPMENAGFPKDTSADALDPNTAMDAETAEHLRQKVMDWPPAKKRETSADHEAFLPERDSSERTSFGSSSGSPLRLHPIDRSSRSNDFRDRSIPNGGYYQGRTADSTVPEGFHAADERASESVFPSSSTILKVVQIHQRYLVTETEEGLVIIDQHALHERILYEKLKKRMNEGSVESQKLLVPYPMDLPPEETACALENAEFLAKLGLLLEPFGGNTLLVTGYPAIFPSAEPAEILQTLLEPILAAGKEPDRTHLLDELMHRMSCKAAVKAGDKLRPDAINELLVMAKEEIASHHCPHGRPSTLVFSIHELDKMFKRL